MIYYKASFYSGDPAYPDYVIPGEHVTPCQALTHVLLDIYRTKTEKRQFYNSLDYYTIHEYDSAQQAPCAGDEILRTWNAAELSEEIGFEKIGMWNNIGGVWRARDGFRNPAVFLEVRYLDYKKYQIFMTNRQTGYRVTSKKSWKTSKTALSHAASIAGSLQWLKDVGAA